LQAKCKIASNPQSQLTYALSVDDVDTFAAITLIPFWNTWQAAFKQMVSRIFFAAVDDA
jgi:hypothetical protein